MNLRDKLPIRKPYDKFFYASTDDPGQLTRVNEYLRRERAGWHLIGQDTRVVNGVYVPHEAYNKAIKVDYSFSHEAVNPAIYSDYLEAVRQRMRYGTSRHENRLFLPKAAYGTVREKMKLTRDPYPGDSELAIDNLSHFMEKGKCKPIHLTLTCGALIDILTPDRLSTSIQTGARCNQSSDENEVHAWVEYKDPRSKKTYIIDPVRGFCGTLAESIKKGSWDYRRESEREASAGIVPQIFSDASVAIVSLADYRNKKRAREASAEVD